MDEMSGKDGTSISGFVHGGENKPPRECGNCIWMGMESCGNNLVILDPQVPKNKDGRGIVDSDDCCNSFQSKGNAIIYIVRHGETEGNKKKEFRGWIDIPLNDQGISEAKLARKFLEDKGIKEVFCSDLGRAVHTAKLVMPSKNPEHDNNMRPWDVGIFSGKSRDIYQSSLNKYIDNPDTPIPDGESLREFAERNRKALEKYIKIAKKEGPILLAVHSSNCIQAEKLIEGKDELGRPEDVDRVLPGGVMCILDEGEAGLKIEVVFGDSPEKEANYGS
jgi:broad specificity phosphatase PhoE